MKSILFTMGIVLSCNVFAQSSYVCTHGEATRIIDVVYTTPGELLPCEVQYTKSTGVKTLWTANDQAGYCESKAKAFANKQEGYGWTCTEQNEAQDNIESKIVEEYQTTESEIITPDYTDDSAQEETSDLEVIADNKEEMVQEMSPISQEEITHNNKDGIPQEVAQ